MDWADPDVLEARVRGFGSESLAAFVADLWAARGFETDRDGAVVTARRDEQTRVVYVLTGRGGTPPVETARPVDVVVASGRPRAGETLAAELNARVVDAAGLTGMLRYAIERDVAADLCERHFGAAPEAVTAPPRDRVRRAVERLEAETVVTVLLAAFVVAVGAGAVFGPTNPGVAGDETPDEAAVTPGTVTSPGGDGPGTVTVDAGSSPTDTGVSTPAVVPGVSETGISNASRLAEAHAATVAGTSSYTIWFDYYAPETGSTGRVQYDVDVRVEGEQAVVETSREPAGGTRSLLSAMYFDGTDQYSVTNNGGGLSRLDNRTPTATPRAVSFLRPGRMVRVYLATPESTVTATESDEFGERYRLEGTGRPGGLPDTVTEYEMTAVVDERGFVRLFEAEFSISRDGDSDGVTDRQRVRLTWTYDRVNSTEIRITGESTNRMTTG
ncbi:hypothetical protein [Halobellus ruber]|uniref:Uncharacterized protein n=1 Tax=Halobellus ruber TaxID=2761102 RepID=A0A7J9SHW8_9EURY|nr:hypothetical protein [Halobellus ruber]MBB6646560.1 hypothetical protein [Halobellus ruber]